MNKVSTLRYRIDEHARLFINLKKSTLLMLIWSCSFINFLENLHPAQLFNPARLLKNSNKTFFNKSFSEFFWTFLNFSEFFWNFPSFYEFFWNFPTFPEIFQNFLNFFQKFPNFSKRVIRYLIHYPYLLVYSVLLFY